MRFLQLLACLVLLVSCGHAQDPEKTDNEDVGLEYYSEARHENILSHFIR